MLLWITWEVVLSAMVATHKAQMKCEVQRYSLLQLLLVCTEGLKSQKVQPQSQVLEKLAKLSAKVSHKYMYVHVAYMACTHLNGAKAF